jgi:flavin-dependent dehydrogenase
VNLVLGATVTEVLTENGHVVGVRTRDREYRAALVVAADGHRSRVAALAGVQERNLPNQRGFLYGYYRNVNGAALDTATVWAVGDSWGVVAPTDGDLTQLVAMPLKDRLPSRADELAGYLESFVEALPGGPDLAEAERVGKLVVSRDYPMVRRNPTPKPGLALIGDAALTSDPTPATGCTWAMWSGAWLADNTAAALSAGARLDAGLRKYRRAHRRIERDFRFISADARAGKASPVQRLIWKAAARDADIAHKALLVGMQQQPVTTLLRPRVLARAVITSRHPRPPDTRSVSRSPVAAVSTTEESSGRT